MHVLHHKPADGLEVIDVDAGSFNQLGLELGDRVGVRIGVEVDCDCVYHFDDNYLKTCSVLLRNKAWLESALGDGCCVIMKEGKLGQIQAFVN